MFQCIGRGSNPHTFRYRGLSSARLPFTPPMQRVPSVRFELTMDLSPARVLSPPHVPFCYKGIALTAGLEPARRSPGYSRFSGPQPCQLGLHEQSASGEIRTRNGSYSGTGSEPVAYSVLLQRHIISEKEDTRLRCAIPRYSAHGRTRTCTPVSRLLMVFETTALPVRLT